jgi:predicted nucleic acid-binding protein
MVSDAPIVIYDANILFPFHVGHILTFMAVRRLVLAKWTEKIQSEWLENIAEQFPDDLAGCTRRCAAMNRALPDAMVTDYEHLIENIAFPDPDDRHVIAAAIHSRAVGIVTRDRRHFTLGTLAPFGLAAIDPDELLVGCHDRFPADCVAAIEAARLSLTRTSPSWDQYLDILERRDLPSFVRRVRDGRSDPNLANS